MTKIPRPKYNIGDTVLTNGEETLVEGIEVLVSKDKANINYQLAWYIGVVDEGDIEKLVKASKRGRKLLTAKYAPGCPVMIKQFGDNHIPTHLVKSMSEWVLGTISMVRMVMWRRNKRVYSDTLYKADCKYAWIKEKQITFY